MGTQASEKRAGPPYLPFKTFLNFIDLLLNTAIPARIDSSIMSKYPGSIKGQLRAALAYIGAIDDGGNVQPSFRELVKARGTDKWRDVFSVQFFSWYRELLGDIDLDTASLQQLKDCFKAAGVEGSVIIKATRFFLAGLDEAGVSYSPFFRVRGALSGGGSAPRPKKPKPIKREEVAYSSRSPGESNQPAIPAGSTRLDLPINGGRTASLILPDDTSVEDWTLIDTYVRLLRQFKPAK